MLFLDWMKQILAGFLFLCTATLFGQQNPAMGKRDTLKYAHRTGGAIAEIDHQNSFMGTTAPGGPFSRDENTLPFDFFQTTYGGVKAYSFTQWNPMRFSGLPHLGFGYQFGSQATQYVHVRYTHAFTPKLLLNVDYDMIKANGFMRNSTAANHNVQIRLQRQSDFYSFSLKAQYLGRNSQYNDGLADTSLLGSLGLGFIQVNKADAQAKTKGARIELEHYFDFLKNDSINATGIYVDNHLRVLNRRYREETFDMDSIYGGTGFFSSDSIADQSQLSELITGAGLYYNRPNFYIKAGLQHNYWQYSNLGTLFRQSEVNVDAKLAYIGKKIEITDHSNFNLVGANREWFTHAKVVADFKSFKLNAALRLDNLLPEPFQRNYRGNYIQYNYALGDLKNQWKMQIDGAATYEKTNFSVKAFTGFAGMTNVYWYNNGAWAQDNNTAYNAFTVGGEFKGRFFNWLNVGAKAMYSSANWMPDVFGRLRLAAGGKVLKGKKLYSQIGVEGTYLTEYDLIGFSPMFENYRYEQGMGISPSRWNLHVFGALEVQTFRFFFRVENIGHIFQDSNMEVMKGYYITPLHFRIGITWDFFN